MARWATANPLLTTKRPSGEVYPVAAITRFTTTTRIGVNSMMPVIRDKLSARRLATLTEVAQDESEQDQEAERAEPGWRVRSRVLGKTLKAGHEPADRAEDCEDGASAGQLWTPIDCLRIQSEQRNKPKDISNGTDDAVPHHRIGDVHERLESVECRIDD
jgi:hypothetical protein